MYTYEPPSKSIVYAWYKNVSYRFWGGAYRFRLFCSNQQRICIWFGVKCIWNGVRLWDWFIFIVWRKGEFYPLSQWALVESNLAVCHMLVNIEICQPIGVCIKRYSIMSMHGAYTHIYIYIINIHIYVYIYICIYIYIYVFTHVAVSYCRLGCFDFYSLLRNK